MIEMSDSFWMVFEAPLPINALSDSIIVLNLPLKIPLNVEL